ncbi:MAG: DEAD/DEAH box helicase [Planctomycetales bacterium]|nr:DEAD/DEAH box helicase [Planctomycetales bacterium]MCA9169043.1 DEAD/DEAH box helicase [Planctomycetales bacterium]
MTQFVKRQQQLIESYEKIDPSIRQLVQLPVADEPMSRSKLFELASRVGAKHADGRALTYKSDASAIDAAIKAGVLECEGYSKSGRIHVAGALQDYVFRDAFATGIAQRVKGYYDDLQKKSGSRFSYGFRFGWNEDKILRNMRFAFYANDWEEWKNLTNQHPCRPCMLDPFCQSTYDTLSPQLQEDFFKHCAMTLVNDASSRLGQISALATDLLDKMPKPSGTFIAAATDLLTAQGNVAALRRLAARFETHPEILGCAAFLVGDYATAHAQFEAADQRQRKTSKKRSTNLSGFPMLLYGILLLKENSAKSQVHLKQIIKTMKKWDDDWYEVSLPLEVALSHQINPTLVPMLFLPHEQEMSALHILVAGWIWRWYFAANQFQVKMKKIDQLVQAYRESKLDWLVAELSAIAAHMSDEKKSDKRAAEAKAAHATLSTVSIVDLVQAAPAWEAGLNALENLCQPTAAGVPATQHAEERMIWEADFGTDWISLTPFIQKRTTKGWGTGRKVRLSRLYEQWQSLAFDFLTDQDRAICRSLRQHTERNYRGYNETYCEWDEVKLISGVVGHPHLYRTGCRDEPIQVSEGRPHLTINQSGKQIKLEIEPKPVDGDEPLCVIREGSHRYSIVSFSQQQLQVAALIAGMPALPADQQERIFKVAQSLASVIDVQSDIEGAPSTGEEVSASTQTVAQLTPYDAGLRVEFFVQPFGEKGPFCRPGVGSPAMLAHVEGKSLTTTRDVNAERQNLQRLLGECRSLETRTVSDDQMEWLFPESDDALEFVAELQALAEQGQVTVMWPRGKTHDIAGRPVASNFQVSVRRDNDWFAASGKLKVDSSLSIDLMKLLDLASVSPSRFVRLDDGRYLALTQELRQRIADIAAFGSAMKNKLRFPPARAVVVDEMIEDIGFKTDQHWKSHLSRIQEAGSIATEVPSTLQANLRDYQRDGYAWLKRLAYWNTGACLADDMGLGKTIQALALLLARASEGPQLVIAPASVAFNWENETRRFAPTLTPKLFRDGDRDQFFSDIQAGDLVITSYGLLQSEIARFEAVQWKTALLDEAQAVKNTATKRSQAVMQLQANFRLILTGTPMENHLGELWNLFRFIVPGLLGSQDEFRSRFAIPIERDNCRATRNRLKKLIQPFLLRRTKSEVLTELPSRTESVLEVELSPAEAALYEALRQQALERISAAAEDSQAQGEQHLQVLAELTRLRLACCHPELVGGNGIESTKLELFREKIAEIIEGQHKVLVFSQFVKHLAILRKALDDMGVSYLYLDGSTPVAKRKEAVEAFQDGEGDVFLISLKAGGTGLNLTAADYVIHMDPWWNPAVEDQATDRAHRIGQQRPVNVYRLITKGTIEEKIVELHNSKRDLADSLLEGSDSSGKLTTEELIGLLRDNSLAENIR